MWHDSIGTEFLHKLLQDSLWVGGDGSCLIKDNNAVLGALVRRTLVKFSENFHFLKSFLNLVRARVLALTLKKLFCMRRQRPPYKNQLSRSQRQSRGSNWNLKRTTFIEPWKFYSRWYSSKVHFGFNLNWRDFSQILTTFYRDDRWNYQS